MKLERGDKRPPIANHVLTIMVRGLLIELEFPYAHFGTEGVTADFLYPIVWEAIWLLEADGVKVLCITADGASPNKVFQDAQNSRCVFLTKQRIHTLKKSGRSFSYQIHHI